MNKSGHDTQSYFSDGIMEWFELIQEKCPGGIYGLFGVTVAAILTWKYVSQHLCLSKTKKKIQERQVMFKNNIKQIRQRVETCKGSGFHRRRNSSFSWHSAKIIDISITDIPFLELQSKLQSGELTCRQVLLAYQAKAIQLSDETNCVTGFVEDAEERAIKLDGLNADQRGPLHGIPISMKETVGVAGQDCTAGLSYFIGKVHKDYGIMMKVLIKQGAVPFVRSSVSQGLLCPSSSNPIFGEGIHPKNHGRTCGGSSGGEGALLGGNASILGVGCDMGGSIRIPAHFCGICGLRSTGGRMSDVGNLPLGHGVVALKEIYGPMGRDVSTLVAFFQAALDNEMFRLDPLIPKMPWRQELFMTKPKKIGYYLTDGGIEPVPAVKRAVIMAKTALEKMGYKVVEFTPPDAIKIVVKYAVSTLMCDDGIMFNSLLKHDVLDPGVKTTLSIGKMPYRLRWLLSKLLYFLHPVEREMLGAPCSNHVYDWWMRNEAREICRQQFIDEMQSQGIEALIGPTLPVAAWPLKDDAHAMACMTYTMLYNALDFPAGAVPVTQVNTEDIKKMDSYPNRYTTEQFVHRISKGSENLPITVQCASLPFQEEVVLRVLKDVETGLKK